jgi:hypothetical protein
VIDEAIVREMASDLGFDARMNVHARIPSMDIPATWSPNAEEPEEVLPPAKAAGAIQENPPVPEIPLDLVPEPQPVEEDPQITSDDLDLKLEEFFEDTFKDN